LGPTDQWVSLMGRMAVVATMAMTIGLGSVEAVAGQATVPCPPGAIQVRIAQAGPDGSVVTAPDKIANEPYRAFVSAVLGQLPGVLAGTGQCQGAARGKAVMEAVFVHIPMIGVTAQTPSDRRQRLAREARVTHQLTSPWIVFDRDDAATPQMRAIFIWNERQILLDQLILSLRAQSRQDRLGKIPLNSISNDDYFRYQTLFNKRFNNDERYFRDFMSSPDIPDDLNFLFRISWIFPETSIPFFDQTVFTRVISQYSSKQMNLSVAFILRSILYSEARYRLDWIDEIDEFLFRVTKW
jgi:hypothetical protein